MLFEILLIFLNIILFIFCCYAPEHGKRLIKWIKPKPYVKTPLELFIDRLRNHAAETSDQTTRELLLRAASELFVQQYLSRSFWQNLKFFSYHLRESIWIKLT